MKTLNLILLSAIFTSFSIFSNAAIFETDTLESEPVDAVEVLQEDAEQNKKEVKLTALPAAIVDALKSDVYSGWEAQRAYEIDTNGEVHYEIVVKKGAEQKSLYFSREGKEIEKR